MSFPSPVDHQTYRQLVRRSLILCASLVQNPANLGGLCRTAEVFRLERMTVANENVKTQAAFKNLAVSSQFWQPLAVWHPEQLAEQFQIYQDQGYAIIALQQQEQAIEIQEFQFPKQSILVLGRELTGIPTEVSDMCDRRIMIPQAGIVDSLNVQVAAAIAIYEYARQFPISKISDI